MSVVAYADGVLAADCQGTSQGHKYRSEKLVRLPHAVVATVGDGSAGRSMVEWFQQGEHPETYPAFQMDREQSCYLIVAKPGELYFYGPTPAKMHRDPKGRWAWGSGRDFALGALAHGASAAEAVAITNDMSNECGFGVTWGKVEG